MSQYDLLCHKRASCRCKRSGLSMALFLHLVRAQNMHAACSEAFRRRTKSVHTNQISVISQNCLTRIVIRCMRTRRRTSKEDEEEHIRNIPAPSNRSPIQTSNRALLNLPISETRSARSCCWWKNSFVKAIPEPQIHPSTSGSWGFQSMIHLIWCRPADLRWNPQKQANARTSHSMT